MLLRDADRDCREAGTVHVRLPGGFACDFFRDERVGRKRRVGTVLLGAPDGKEDDVWWRVTNVVPRCFAEVHGSTPFFGLRSGGVMYSGVHPKVIFFVHAYQATC